MQTHLVSKIMHQNLAIILQQFNFSKNSFIVLVPGSPESDPPDVSAAASSLFLLLLLFFFAEVLNPSECMRLEISLEARSTTPEMF